MIQLGKRARQKIERPTEILEAAMQEFVHRGYHAARLEDVARKTGVTKGTIYFYFETKEALFAAVIRHFGPPVLADATDAARPVLQQITDYLAQIYRVIATEPKTREVFHLLVSEGRHFPELVDRYFSEFLAPAQDHLRKLIHTGVASGELRKTDADRFPELLVAPAVLANVWSVVFGARKQLEADAFWHTHVDILVQGLRR